MTGATNTVLERRCARLRELHVTGVRQHKTRLADHMDMTDKDWQWVAHAMTCIRAGDWATPCSGVALPEEVANGCSSASVPTSRSGGQKSSTASAWSGGVTSCRRRQLRRPRGLDERDGTDYAPSCCGFP